MTVISCISLERHIDVLDLRAREQLLDRLLAADARLLVAAERHADPVLTRAVDPYVAGLDPRGEAVRAVEVVRPDRAGQPDVERIDACKKIALLGPAQHAHHRPEVF